MLPYLIYKTGGGPLQFGLSLPTAQSIPPLDPSIKTNLLLPKCTTFSHELLWRHDSLTHLAALSIPTSTG